MSHNYAGGSCCLVHVSTWWCRNFTFVIILISQASSQKLPRNLLIIICLVKDFPPGNKPAAEEEGEEPSWVFSSHISNRHGPTSTTEHPTNISDTCVCPTHFVLTKGHQQNRVRSRSAFAYGLACHRVVIPCHTRDPTRSPDHHRMPSSTLWLPTREITVGSFYMISYLTLCHATSKAIKMYNTVQLIVTKYLGPWCARKVNFAKQ